MDEKKRGGFRVDELSTTGALRCECRKCEWSGRESDLEEIVGCSLEAGKRVPSGRCPKCQALVTVEDDGDQEIADALKLMQRLVEMDEKLRKGRSVGGEDYAETLKAAKKAAKKALLRLRPVAVNEQGGDSGADSVVSG